MDKRHIDWFLSGSNADFGLLSYLKKQAGNGSSNMKIKLSYDGTTSGGKYKGVWLAATTYGANEIVNYPSGSPLYWRSKAGGNVGNDPILTDPTYWYLECGVDILQDSGDGVNFYRYTLGFRNDDFIRLQKLQYGTYANTGLSTLNFQNHNALLYSSSVTSIALPASNPTSRTFTMGTGLDVADSATLGTSVDSFSIPTTQGVSVSLTVNTGLSITPGESLSIYNDATHFFVIVAVSYNSGTGLLTGRLVVNVGTGSFSSWTIKREKLITIVNSTVNYFAAVVQTYNSVTGSTTVNSVYSTASGTLASWTIKNGFNPMPDPGADNDLNFKVMGQYFIGSFTGTAVRFSHLRSTTGMGMKFVYLSGPDSGNLPADITVDTYHATLSTVVTDTALQNLTYGTHTVLVIGVSSPGGGTNTAGWYKSSSSNNASKTLFGAINFDVFTETAPIVSSWSPESEGEFAYSFRDTDSGDTAQWQPEHSNVLTTTGRSRIFTVNGVSIDVSTISSVTNPYLYRYGTFTSFSLSQTLNIIHPQAAGNVSTLSMLHSFDSNGLYYKKTETALQAFFIAIGYNNMIQINEAGFNKIKAENGNYISRPADNTIVNLSGSEANQGSYLFYSTSGASPIKDLVLAQHWPNKARDWRTGLPNSGTSFVQDFSGAAGWKFYPVAFSGYSVANGEVLVHECRLLLGKIINANSNL